MDPITISQIARIRQQELLAEARDDGSITIQKMVWQLGDALMQFGRSLLPGARESQRKSDTLADCTETQELYGVGGC